MFYRQKKDEQTRTIVLNGESTAAYPVFFCKV